MKLIGPAIDRRTECEAILRSLPMWFGIEQALRMYVEDTALLPTFGLEDAGALRGFLTLREHFPESWDIHCLAVHADVRNGGLGSRLLAHAEAWLVGHGVRFLQVKTVAATSDSAAYAETRAFYFARGFTPLEVFPHLWDAHNPALQCVKALRTTE
jgi:GNAT superfamily N-acetyltransferase